MSDTSDSGILDTRFPGFAWMPRWTRKYWTPSTAVAIAVFIFSTGVWWGTFKTAPDVQGLHKDLSVITGAMGDACTKGCLLRKEDINVIESHVQDLWEWKKRIDSEGQVTIERLPIPQVDLNIKPAPAKKQDKMRR